MRTKIEDIGLVKEIPYASGMVTVVYYTFDSTEEYDAYMNKTEKAVSSKENKDSSNQ